MVGLMVMVGLVGFLLGYVPMKTKLDDAIASERARYAGLRELVEGLQSEIVKKKPNKSRKK